MCSVLPSVAYRFDHLVIAVRDLGAAIAGYHDLGFDVRLGGRHTGRGTENAIIRFGLDYLELIAVYDEAEAEQAGRGALVEFLRRQEGGLVAYALATDDIEATAVSLRHNGLESSGPFPMERLRPDGSRLCWRLLVPGREAYRRPWPFFIQWDQEDSERLVGEAPGTHPNGSCRVEEVGVVAANLAAGVDLYGRQLGLRLAGRARPEFGAARAVFLLGDVRIVLHAPHRVRSRRGRRPARGLVTNTLTAVGEGPFQVVLGVTRLEDARSWLEEHGVALEPATDIPDGLIIDPGRAVGARLLLRGV
jgi:catechol 2,3-dioxygenase-like lactoylglutathione lyase family enzyme